MQPLSVTSIANMNARTDVLYVGSIGRRVKNKGALADWIRHDENYVNKEDSDVDAGSKDIKKHDAASFMASIMKC